METIAVLGLSPGTNRLSDPRPPGVLGDTSFADYLSKIELQDSQSAYRSQARSNRPTEPSGGSTEDHLQRSSVAANYAERWNDASGSPGARTTASGQPSDRPSPKIEKTAKGETVERRVTSELNEGKEKESKIDALDAELSVVANDKTKSDDASQNVATTIFYGESGKETVKNADASLVLKEADTVEPGVEVASARETGRESQVGARAGTSDANGSPGNVGSTGNNHRDGDTPPAGIGDRTGVGKAGRSFGEVDLEAGQVDQGGVIKKDIADEEALAASGPNPHTSNRGNEKGAAFVSASSVLEPNQGKGNLKDPRGRRIAEAKNERIAAVRRNAKASSPASIDAERDAKRIHRIEVHLDHQENGVEQNGGRHTTADTTTPERAESDVSTFLSRMEHAPATRTQRFAGMQNATQALARRLNGDLGNSIVRHAKIMLKESGTAEIRLIIRPPELGRVRINMQMENGHIAGRILVDNGNVREVLEQNLAALERAFQEAGLEVGEFEVSTGDSRGEAASDGDTHRKTGRGPARKGAGSFAESVEPVVVNDYSHRTINLVA